MTDAPVADPTPDTEPTPDPTPVAQPPAPDDGRDAAMARERRAREDAEKRAKEAEDKLAAEAKKKAEEEGKWKELAEEEAAKREAIEAKASAAEARRNAEKAAGDLKFKDTGYALYLLQQDSVDLTDPAAVKAALAGLAESRKDLVAGYTPPPSGGPAGGAQGDPPGLTREQIEAMSPQQVAAIDPKVINEALKH